MGKGVLLVALATLAFAASDVLTKSLTQHLPVAAVVAVRYAVNLGLLTAVLGPSQGAGLWRVRRKGLVTLRGACLALGSLTMGLALRVMPLAETVAIIYLSPLVVMALSPHLLGEATGRLGWIAAGVGFLGVLVILRPGGGLDPFGVAMALVNVACATAYHLLTRKLAGTETTLALLWHTALVGTLGFGVLATVQGWPGFGLADLGQMVLLGALATSGHFLFTAAYRHAPAARLAPVNYLHLVWAAALGWAIWGHVPDAAALLGMALVAGSGLAALRR